MLTPTTLLGDRATEEEEGKERRGGGECEEVQGGSGVVGGVVSLGLVLNVLQCLFVLFFTWERENSRFVQE